MHEGFHDEKIKAIKGALQMVPRVHSEGDQPRQLDPWKVTKRKSGDLCKCISDIMDSLANVSKKSRVLSTKGSISRDLSAKDSLARASRVSSSPLQWHAVTCD